MTTITALPSAPSRSSTPSTFSADADAWVAALDTFVTETNTVATEVNGYSTSASASANTSAASATASADSATAAAASASLANFQGTYAGGTTYAVGESVIDSGLYYLSLQSSNTGNTPASSPSYWDAIISAGAYTATASGAISAGDMLALNAAGTVSSATGVAHSQGSAVAFESGTVESVASCYDTLNNKVVVVYRDTGNSSYGTAAVGTVSGDSISWGTPVVFKSAEMTFISCCFDPVAGKVVIAYRGPSANYYGYAVVGTVSGTSISFGSEATFEAANSYLMSCCYDSTADKTVIAYRDVGNSNYGTAIVGTVSGTSISFGSPTVFSSAGTMIYISCTYDSTSDKTVIAYGISGTEGRAIVGTVSGTSISFGSEATFNTSAVAALSCCYDSTADKTVIAYSDNGNSSYGTAIVGSVSGTSISFGDPYVFNESSIYDYVSVAYDITNDRTVISYADGGNSNYGTVLTSRIFGSSLLFTGSSVFNSSTTAYLSSVFDPDTDQVVATYRGTSNYGQSMVIVPERSNINATTFVGVASAAATDTATVTIITPGLVDTNQTGLTVGTSYYIGSTGTLSTDSADGPLAGKAVTTTAIQVA